MNRMLDGLGAVAQRLTEHAGGVEVSRDQVRRWARRGHEPLPLRWTGRMAKVRIVADPEELATWARAEFQLRPYAERAKREPGSPRVLRRARDIRGPVETSMGSR